MQLLINKSFTRAPIIYSLLLLGILSSLISCDKFVDIERPQDKLLTSEVFSSDQTALSGLYGIYSFMGRGSTNMLVSSHSSAGMSADELVRGSYFELDEQFQNNALMATNARVRFLWTDAYKIIYYTNSMLEGMAASTSMTENTKSQLRGECYFLRALHYFMLVNFYGDVPLVTGTDYKVNLMMARTPKADVYQYIQADLESASTLLTDEYPLDQRIRPNGLAAKALLARVKLYVGEYQSAELLASQVISSPLYSLEAELDNVFSVSSQEAIWQVYPTDNNSRDTYIGSTFIPNGDRIPSYVFTPQLLNAFEPGDQRREKWVGKVTVSGVDYFYIYKYKVRARPVTTSPVEYMTPLRLAEQYLIRAEARAMQGKLFDAMEDVNIIRQRAGLPPRLNVNTKEAALEAITKERRIELMVEFGHRWFDLKRTGVVNAVMASTKGSLWQPTDALYPIHVEDLATGPNLTQNPGYN